MNPIASEQTVADVVAGQSCPLCGTGGEFYGLCGPHEVRQCSNGHAPILLSWQWATVNDYESMYSTPHMYHEDCQKLEGQKISVERDEEHKAAAQSRVAWLRTIAPACDCRELLDIGAGTGAFVHIAEMHGYYAVGIEPSPDLARWARERRREVTWGGWREVKGVGHWNIITMHDVWEHLTQPMECLAHLRACLRDTGLLVIEIPEWGSPHQQRDGLNWRHIRPTQHLFLPSDAAAQEMFRQAGFAAEMTLRPLSGQIGKIAYYLRKVVD